jgi:RNA-directed DNA polymerase
VVKGGREIRLAAAAATPIQRHVKVQVTANPYDPPYATYFAERRAKGRSYAYQGGI